jgi:hypothetical protein
MVLPLLFGLAGSALGGAGALSSIPLLSGLGAVGAGALGSGLGRFVETGDLGKGIETGLTSFVGGKALGALGKGLDIEALKPSTLENLKGATAMETGINTLMNPISAGQAAIGQATVPPPMPPPVAPVPFENRQAGVPDRITRRPPQGYRPGFDAEFDYGVSPNFGVGLMNPNDPRFMNSGGIMALSNGGELKPIPDDNPGLKALAKEKPSVVENMGFKAMQEGGAVEGDMEANKIIDDAVNAIKGLSDSPEIALGVFVAKYGEEALEDLIERVNDGEFDQPREDNMIEGEGDGMDDKVPATLEGEQDVMLSDGEFVVPADVVSGIGNGSSDAGARELEDMMTRVRQLRTGKKEQPKQVPQEMMLPV